ncbi:hypothetical protein [Kitasatospora sp. NPDC086791]|uniref:hypothetical protein n=1 Tax=Kitasatospora sp. NPDC086791 TaxID=3155178 RepID=UPI00343C0294
MPETSLPRTPGTASRGYAGPVTAYIKGITEHAEFAQLPDAMAALLSSVSTLPLEAGNRVAIEQALAPSRATHIAEQLDYLGQVSWCAFVELDIHLVRIRTGSPSSLPRLARYRAAVLESSASPGCETGAATA